MTRERPTVSTVYFATTSAVVAGLEDDDVVEVSIVKPDDSETWDVLYELHPRATDLIDADHGRFKVTWGKAMNSPYHTSTR